MNQGNHAPRHVGFVRIVAILAVLLFVGPASANHQVAALVDPIVEAAESDACTFGGVSLTIACPTWTDAYNGQGSGTDYALKGVLSADGSRYFVVANSQASASRNDLVTTAYDTSTGDRVWSARHDGGANAYARNVALSPDESLVYALTMVQRSQGGWDIQIVAYDPATGAHQWTATYVGPNTSWHYTSMAGLAFSPDGTRIYLAGQSIYANGTGQAIDAIVLVYDALTGASVSARVYEGVQDFVTSFALSPDGTRLYLTGSKYLWTPSTPFDRDWTMASIDTASGDVIWNQTYDAAGLYQVDQGVALALSSDGSTIYVTGQSYGAGTSEDILTIAYDAATGATRWISRFDGTGHDVDRPTAIALSPDGSRVFVTGSSVGWLTGVGYVTLAYDTNDGTQLWQERYDNSGSAHPDNAKAIALSPDGDTVVVTGGSSLGAAGEEMGVQTIAYDVQTGDVVWNARYFTRAPDAASITIDPTGTRAYVAGQSYSTTTGYDALVIGYDLPLVKILADTVNSIGGA
ncbi:MAG: WD40 repeat domain-containing protein [Candidatus Thermoplasmatota archaeon]